MSELPSLEHLDEAWYSRLLDISALTDGQNFLGDAEYRKEQKRAFINGEIENPTLDYPFIDHSVLEEAEEKLVGLKKDVLEFEPHQIVRQAYRWTLNEKIAGIRRLQAGANGQVSRFQRYSEFMFGSPSPDIFNYTVHSLRSAAAEATGSEDERLRDAARELLDALPEAQPFNPIDLPDAETIKFACDQTRTEFSSMLDIPTDKDELDADGIKQGFDLALGELPESNWTAEIDENTSRNSISVRQGSRRVLIPKDRKMSEDKFRELVAEEIGTHVLRRINGERSRLKLLGLGLDRVGRAEEGISLTRQQAMHNEVKEYRGLDGYLAIGLAMGIDGQPRDFRGVYEILKKLYVFNNLREGQDIEKANKNAQDRAWQRCIRTFRGTDCRTPGVSSRRDIFYRDGNIMIWDLIRKNPKSMSKFNLGKYDPTNPRHLWILEQLGIMDEEQVA